MTLKDRMKAFPPRVFTDAKTKLLAAGWVEYGSVMNGSGDEGEQFGVCFLRNGQEFYLNYKTLGKLPA